MTRWNEEWLWGALRHINRNVDTDCFFDYSDKPKDFEVYAPSKEDAPLVARAPELLDLLREWFALSDITCDPQPNSLYNRTDRLLQELKDFGNA